MVASCTPCDASATVSRSGHFVAFMRLRNSVSSASGTLKRKGRTAVGVVSWVWFSIIVLLWCGELQMCRDGEVPHLVNVSVERPDADAYCGEGRWAHVVPAVP